ncbi:hypothetical protein JCM10207_001766 [Rhodosporidiobolus poonsookiae]
MASTFKDLPNNTASSWWKDPSLRRNVATAIICYFGSYSLGYDGSYLNGLQSLTTWQTYWDHPRGTRLGLISAMSYLPALAIMPVYPIICDYGGRRFSAMLGCLILFAGAILGGLATNEGMLLGGRALVGIAGSFLSLACNLLCNEILHPRLRSVGSAFFLVFYYTGSATSAWISYGVIRGGWASEWSWRLPTIVQAAGPCIVFFGSFFIDESPRFLMARGKREKALKVLARQHANGKENDPLVVHEMQEIEAALEREKREKLGFLSFLKTPGNRRRLLIVALTGTGTQATGITVFSYYLAPALRLAGVTNPSVQTGVNGGLALFNLVLAGVGASLVERVGRRKLWLISTVGMLFSYTILIGLSGGFASTQDKNTGLATIAFIFLTYGFYDIAWTPLAYSYTTEILPYSLRASGMALFIFGQKGSLAACQWINPIGLDAIGWKYYFVFFATLILYSVMLYLFFPETRGLSLEEVAMIFDDANEASNLQDRKEAVDAQVKFDRQLEHREFSGADSAKSA